MPPRLVNNFLIGISCMIISACRQPYNPPVARSNLNYLVVDGIIVNGPDSTIINLSRTANITDSGYTPSPETGAIMSVLGEQGESYPLREQSPGKYTAPQLNLSLNETYQLRIITTNGNVYLSDSIPVKTTPPIDSVFWKNNDTTVNIYVTTHDPRNNTWYYRWQYTETWEYQAIYLSQLIYQNGTTIRRPPTQEIYTCWSTDHSTDILVGTSTGLSRDLIYEQPLADDTLQVSYYPVNIPLVLPGLSQKFMFEYSILVNQYAIPPAAYSYWYNLKQTTEELGGLFSPEPSSEVPGNIHNVANPKEPVLGFITASTLQQKRIFISHYDLFKGTAVQPEIGCYEFLVVPDSINYYLQYARLFTPLDSVEDALGNFQGLETAPTYCADCRANGGVNLKPPYWPN